MTNRNTEYEQLVAQMHQGMLNYDGYENLRVEHDVKIKGKSGAMHQIDVYWEFKAAGTTYKTCVECKNYSSAVKKQHIAAFAEILRDIGNANGIIATTSSFQKGAKLLAQENNIRLVLVNNLINSVHLSVQPLMTDFDNVNICFNQKCIETSMKENGLEKYEMKLNLSGEHPLFDINGDLKDSFNGIIKKHPLNEGRNSIECEDLYFYTKDLGPILIDSISFDVSYRRGSPIESIIESPNTATAVIEDIVNNNLHYLHNDGRISTEPNNA